MCFGEWIVSRFTIHPSIHLLTILLGYFEVLISMKEVEKFVDYELSLWGLGNLSRDGKMSRNWSRRPRRGTAASDYRWTNGAGKRYMFCNRRGLRIYFWSGGYEIRENFTRLEGVFGKFG